MATLLQLLASVLVSNVWFTCSAQVNIRAEPGQNIVLPCRVANSGPIKVVDWTRDNLGSYRVLLYRSSQFVSDQQHPSFKGRVDLQDRQMKDGNVSLVLRDAAAEDSGTYKCQVVQSGAKNMNSNPNCIINLDVARESRIFKGTGRKAGPSGPVIGLTLLLLLLFKD
ncbi:coxsackievirus and adenovirus receptor homolog [Xiphophorus maculatus]|uniref:coxsackievirus and adenovirus receptor homolog n=1 Tax=Xiphophorus maculatus TaxID=8083 RepID=UPI0003B3FF08|nr:coxsackievirus and adenovirus receptor homolog [Xiphophorus maculatus]